MYECEIQIAVKKVYRNEKGEIVREDIGESISLDELKQVILNSIADVPGKFKKSVEKLPL